MNSEGQLITEQGKVVAIEADGIWVETANQSACGKCAARKGCGQSLLAQIDGHRSYIKAGLNGYSPAAFREGAIITIGVHEDAITRGSLLVYCLPLLGLIAGATLGDAVRLPEAGIVALAISGLFLCGLAVRVISRRQTGDERFQPIVVNLSVSATDDSSQDVVVVEPALSKQTQN